MEGISVLRVVSLRKVVGPWEFFPLPVSSPLPLFLASLPWCDCFNSAISHAMMSCLTPAKILTDLSLRL